METCERTLPLTREITDTPVSQGETLTGYAVVYGQRSHWIQEHGQSFHEVIDRGAFTESLKKNNVTFVFRHDDNAEYGDTQSGTLTLTEDEKGIRFALKLPAYAHSMRAKIASGAISGMSFKFIPTDISYDGTTRHIRKGELLHVSPVYTPAYPQTSVKLASVSQDARRKRLQLTQNGML